MIKEDSVTKTHNECSFFMEWMQGFWVTQARQKVGQICWAAKAKCYVCVCVAQLFHNSLVVQKPLFYTGHRFLFTFKVQMEEDEGRFETIYLSMCFFGPLNVDKLCGHSHFMRKISNKDVTD